MSPRAPEPRAPYEPEEEEEDREDDEVTSLLAQAEMIEQWSQVVRKVPDMSFDQIEPACGALSTHMEQVVANLRAVAQQLSAQSNVKQFLR